MLEIYQKTLYRQEADIWHYLRLFWLEESQLFEVRSAFCGQNAAIIGQEALIAGETKADALHRLVSALMRAGYISQPKKTKELNVVINTPGWGGFSAGAPWFDQLQSDFLYPLYAFLEETANGGNSEGVMTEDGRITHYFWVLDRESTLSKIAELAKPLEAAFNIIISTNTSIDSPMPPMLEEVNTRFAEELFAALKNSSQDLRQAIINSLPPMENSQQTYPDRLGDYIRNAPNRVWGEKAAHLREKLMTIWGIGKEYWPPTGDSAPYDIIQVANLDLATRKELIDLICSKIQGELYVFEVQDGIFLTTPDEIFKLGLDDRYVFDAGMSWMVYTYHHGITYFGGDWLTAAVRELYRDREEELNPWFRGG